MSKIEIYIQGMGIGDDLNIVWFPIISASKKDLSLISFPKCGYYTLLYIICLFKIGEDIKRLNSSVDF